METYDFRALRELLHSWGLLELYQHFKDEGVNINEMKIMKYHHVIELLQHFKMGTRVRFDYHYERWRRNLHKPLAMPGNASKILSSSCCSHCSNHLTHDVSPKRQSRIKRQKSRTTSLESNEAMDAEVTAIISPAPSPPLGQPPPVVPAPSFKPTLPSHNEVELPKEMPKLTPQPKRFASVSTTESTEKPRAVTPPLPPPPAAKVPMLMGQSLRLNSLGDPLSSMHFYDTLEKPFLSIMRILQTSGRKGLEILDYYQTHKELKNSHRWLLINLIVNFFDDNNLHLSLNMSHHLEKQILELFPTEKLEYYRTEKRGRIYVKFSNMKRYQRERSGVKRKWNKSLTPLLDKDIELVDGNTEDDNCSLTLESWVEQPTTVEDSNIKTEVNSGDDFN